MDSRSINKRAVTWTKLRQYSRRKSRSVYSFLAAAVFILGFLSLTLEYTLSSPDDLMSHHEISKRSFNISISNRSTPIEDLLDATTIPNIGNYPKEVFTLKQLRHGAVILHTAGMIYMFIALAIVCDEFFVPALEVITDKLHLTEDVAGATFMAAGGSAPELFTSVAGLFISQNSVGISTIIGSAVFNILFVIGACALAARELLKLTWWPLFRDTCFYSLSLIVLIVSYLDWKIHFYEALCLLACYAAYVTFMVFNRRIETAVKSRLCNQSTPKISTVDLVPVSNKTSMIIVTVNGGQDFKLMFESQDSGIDHGSPLKFRAGLLQLMIHTIDPLAEGKIEDRALQLRRLGMKRKPSSTAQQEATASPSPITANPAANNNKPEVYHGFSNGAANHDTPNHTSQPGMPNNSDIEMMPRNSIPVTAVSCQDKPAENGNNVEAASPADEEEDDNAPLDVSWPKTTKKRITYVLLAPIIFLLWLTLPDPRRPEKRKWFAVTFIGSIVWIAFFSIMMVWWASIICVTIGIPVEIIGLTVLAAGTSVPDLLTSVIVARKGFGDMAISSSIGSNIFDITVGLPLPWLVGSLLKIPNPYVDVDATGLLCSIILLFGMLLVTVGSIALSRWQMSKALGLFMIIMYMGFLAVSVLLSLGIIPCIDVKFV